MSDRAKISCSAATPRVCVVGLVSSETLQVGGRGGAGAEVSAAVWNCPSVCLSTRPRPRPSTVINILQAFDNLRHLSSRCPEPFSKLPFIRAGQSGDGEDRQPRERRLTFLLIDFGSFCARLISGNVLRGGQKYRKRNK